MFHYHTTFNLALLVLIAGTGLLIWSSREVAYKILAKVIAYGVIIGALISILCSLYYVIQYWNGVYFKTPDGASPMAHCPMMSQDMEMNHMMKMPIMKEMIEKQTNDGSGDLDSSSKNNSNSHKQHDHDQLR